jgi:hypothetical protein
VKSEKGKNPRKDGSLFEDKPQVALSKTLGHEAAGSQTFGRGEPLFGVRERRRREGVSIA